MNWWNTVVTFFRKLPVAQYLKPIWKGALKEAVQLGGDKLQSEIDAQLASQAADALPKVQTLIAGLPARFSSVVAAVPCLPAAWAQAAQQAVGRSVAGFQAQTANVFGDKSVVSVQNAFDAAFDTFQVDLIARISAL